MELVPSLIVTVPGGGPLPGPRALALLVNVAWPELRVPVPRVLPPSLKVTVPDGVPEPGETGLTWAVKVTDWPTTDGLAEEERVVVVLALLTVWVMTVEVLALKLSSALYAAVIE